MKSIERNKKLEEKNRIALANRMKTDGENEQKMKMFSKLNELFTNEFTEKLLIKCEWGNHIYTN